MAEDFAMKRRQAKALIVSAMRIVRVLGMSTALSLVRSSLCSGEPLQAERKLQCLSLANSCG
jgi:hypothetical protein